MTEIPPENFDWDAECCVTHRKILDDCHITIEFGYGSDKDMMTYAFSPVCDDVGKGVLKFLKIISTHECFDVEDFGKDMIDEIFNTEEE